MGSLVRRTKSNKGVCLLRRIYTPVSERHIEAMNLISGIVNSSETD